MCQMQPVCGRGDDQDENLGDLKDMDTTLSETPTTHVVRDPFWVRLFTVQLWLAPLLIAVPLVSLIFALIASPSLRELVLLQTLLVGSGFFLFAFLIPLIGLIWAAMRWRTDRLGSLRLHRAMLWLSLFFALFIFPFSVPAYALGLIATWKTHRILDPQVAGIQRTLKRLALSILGLVAVAFGIFGLLQYRNCAIPATFETLTERNSSVDGFAYVRDSRSFYIPVCSRYDFLFVGPSGDVQQLAAIDGDIIDSGSGNIKVTLNQLTGDIYTLGSRTDNEFLFNRILVNRRSQPPRTEVSLTDSAETIEWYALSPVGDALAYVKGRATKPEKLTTDPSRSCPCTHSLWLHSLGGQSPDLQLIADIDERTLTWEGSDSLTDTTYDPPWPFAWSADGKTLFFVGGGYSPSIKSGRTAIEVFDIASRQVRATHETSTLLSGTFAEDLVIAPDGLRGAFDDNEGDTFSIVDFETGVVRESSPTEGDRRFSPLAWKADGTKLVGVSSDSSESGNLKLSIFDPALGTVEDVHTLDRASHLILEAIWLDDDRIVFTTNSYDPLAKLLWLNQSHIQLLSVHSDGTNLQSLDSAADATTLLGPLKAD